MEIISVRIERLEELDNLSRLLNEKRSEVVRELIEEGKKLKVIELYKQRKISLGLASKISGLTLSEFLDLLEEYNVKLNLSLDDAREAMRNAEELTKQ